MQSEQARETSRKVRTGRVMSDRMEKTIVVGVDSYRPHPLYRKRLRRTKKYHVHDAENQARVGDVVSIMETRPWSKTKRWRLLEVVQTASFVPTRQQSQDEGAGKEG